jgi:hypothetical protein
LARVDGECFLHRGQRAADEKHAIVQVHVLPPQGEHLVVGIAASDPEHQKTLPQSGLLQIRLVGAAEPVRIRPQTRVDRFLSAPQRVDVGMISGQAGRHLGTLGNGAVARDQDIGVPGGLSQPVECRLVGTHLIGAARVEERDQDIGEHVAGKQDATVREEDRGVADGVRLMLENLARHGSAVFGQRGDEPNQLERDARRALRRHRLRPLSGFTGSVGAGGGGVARHVTESGMPEQMIPVGMGREPRDHRNAQPVQVIGELVQIGTIDAGIDQDQPTLAAHHDGIAPDPRTLPHPDTVGHLSQRRITLSGPSPRSKRKDRSHSSAATRPERRR